MLYTTVMCVRAVGMGQAYDLGKGRGRAGVGLCFDPLVCVMRGVGKLVEERAEGA